MATERQLRSAVAATVECMPTELCGLIGGYAARRPHRFNDAGFEWLGSTTVNERKDGTEIKVVDVGDFHPKYSGWHTFVSEEPLAAGQCEWSVELTCTTNNEDAKKFGWIGVGLTVSAKNRLEDDLTDIAGMAGKNDRLLTNIGRRFVLIDGLADGIRCRYIGQISVADRITKIWFTADPLTGIVRARWRHAGDVRQRDAYWTMPESRCLPFGLMRPAVVLAGVASAIVRSEPADMPTDNFLERTVLRSAV
jgi:hypothetical protein